MSEAGTAADDEKAKAAADGLKKILEVLAPEPAVANAEAPTSVVDELYGAISSADVKDYANQARGAVERYRNSTKWLVGAVAAIGIALFGSTAFTDGDALSTGRGWLGLAVASIGLVLVLWAATLVFEPEDASLGELASDLDRARKKLRKDKNDRTTFRKWKAGFSPRLAATYELGEILEGPEWNAHLGHPTVKALIESIGDRISPANGSVLAIDQPRREQALDVANRRRAIATDTTVRTLVDARLDKLLEALGNLDAEGNTTVPPTADGATGELSDPDVAFTVVTPFGTLVILDDGSDTTVPPPESTTIGSVLACQIATMLAVSATVRANSTTNALGFLEAQSKLETDDYQLGLDLLHRDLVLCESGVAQLRGKFQLSRALLLLGAVLTLFGALLYIAGVKSDGSNSDMTEVRTGTLVVAENTTAADAFEKKPDCVGRELNVLYVGDSTPAQSEEFTVTVNSPDVCRGDYKIPSNRGPTDIDLKLFSAVDVAAS